MRVYLYPIRSAIISFPFIALALLMPYLIYDYHKHGSISKWRAFIIYSFIFYLICAYYLVILPLPERESIHTSWREMMQLKPFAFVGDFLRETSMNLHNPRSMLRGLREGVVTQPLFNIVMTIPFGIYLRYYFNKSFKQTLILSFLLSLFFEFTQLSGLYGYYSGPYRLFDVDDLILNTLGGLVGYGVAPAMTYFFPTREVLDLQSAKKSTTVTYLRRFVAYMIDITIYNFALSIFMMGAQAILPTWSNHTTFVMVTNVIGFAFFFAIWPWFHQGSTLGMSVVRIRIQAEGDALRFKQLLIRMIFMYFFIVRFGDITSSLLETLTHYSSSAYLVGTIVYLIIVFSYWAFLLFHILSTLIHKDYRLFYERISKTYIENTYQFENLNE